MTGQGKRVLIADDEGSVRGIVVTLLHQAGYIVHQAVDGLEALAEMKRWHFDALMADYTLPRLDGMRLLLLSRMMWPEVPVLLLSADLTDVPLSLKKQGACALIAKPLDSGELLERLQAATSPAYAEAAADQ